MSKKIKELSTFSAPKYAPDWSMWASIHHLLHDVFMLQLMSKAIIWHIHWQFGRKFKWVILVLCPVHCGDIEADQNLKTRCLCSNNRLTPFDLHVTCSTALQNNFSPTWACVSLQWSTTSSGWIPYTFKYLNLFVSRYAQLSLESFWVTCRALE